MIFDADSCMIFRAVSPWLSTKEGTAGAGMRILMVTVGDRKASGCGSEAWWAESGRTFSESAAFISSSEG
eukprot:CAMPEP_0113245128 /NCGR_PEP_ID=MMETSP0008_2-20120614/8770_1 /TAXON_ID=97485 /ORGANISM="Prymnesium parvum" /LENGTH=69 /DNA_ID=CAMNT_0000092793 /DNA_START=905 /DNA_END=1114 /DNA_ORIENTATION=- /assembly_acc=CAM_ASM_000153